MINSFGDLEEASNSKTDLVSKVRLLRQLNSPCCLPSSSLSINSKEFKPLLSSRMPLLF
jgi:hypothetical protein